MPPVSSARPHRGARAAVLCQPDATEADKLDAITVIRERGDQDALALFGGLAGGYAAGGAGRQGGRSASIEQPARPVGRVQNAWYGLSLGSVLLLAAIGLAITFGVMGVINMAHGEMVMLGAYTTFRRAGDHRSAPATRRCSTTRC